MRLAYTWNAGRRKFERSTNAGTNSYAVFSGFHPHSLTAGHLSEVEESLRNGDDVNAIDKQGRTPLMLAAIGAHSTLVELLLNADADPNIKNKKGWTALRYAIDSHNLDLIRLLIRKGADPDETDADGFTLTRHFVQSELRLLIFSQNVAARVKMRMSSLRRSRPKLLTECGFCWIGALMRTPGILTDVPH